MDNLKAEGIYLDFDGEGNYSENQKNESKSIEVFEDNYIGDMLPSDGEGMNDMDED